MAKKVSRRLTTTIDKLTEGLATLNLMSSLQYCFVYKRGSVLIEGSFRVSGPLSSTAV